jgi:hypothetical protein
METYHLLKCVLHVGLQYDMMKLIKHLNVENKVRKMEDKRENTYRVLLG